MKENVRYPVSQREVQVKSYKGKIRRSRFTDGYKRRDRKERHMNLLDAKEGKEYIVKDIVTEDDELKAFLFSLGCYSGEPITVVSHLKGGCVVSIKDGRYNIDIDLAKAISI